MDIGHEASEAILRETEKDLQSIYRQAHAETLKKLTNYLNKFAYKDQIKLTQLKRGEITMDEYTYWRRGQICIGQRWEEMVSVLSRDFTHANEIAASTINGHLPEAYAINHNYATFQIEHDSLINTSYTLYNRYTVEKLVRDDPHVLPFKAEVNIPKDQRWNHVQINRAVTQSVLQGENVRALSKRLEKTVGPAYSIKDIKNANTKTANEITKELARKNKVAATRNARTAITSAQNAGRMDSYYRAAKMGIEVEKEWLATLDGRTRDSHAWIDGEVVPLDHEFSNGCAYPGDPAGEPEEVYNCRCTMVPHLKHVDQSDAPRNSKLVDMSYEEWKNEHRKQEEEPEVKTLDESYTGLGSTAKFNEYMLKYHPDTIGSAEYVEKSIEQTYNQKFRLEKSIYENDPEYGIREVSMSEYINMGWNDRNMSFPDFESYRTYMLSEEAQNFAEPGSIMDGLRRYNLGATADGYGKGKGARLAFDSEYGLSDFITSNQDVHYTGDTLYRGVKSNKAGIKELQKAMNDGKSINMRGISSWSTSENIANQFTKFSLRGSKTSTPLVFIEEGLHTRNAMPFPYSSYGMLIQSEVVYSGDAIFSVLKMEEKEGCWYVYVREN